MIANTTYWTEFSPNGSTTSFPTTVVAKKATDIQVWYRATALVVPTLLAYPADYSVSNLGAVDGVNLVMTATYPSGSTLSIIRASDTLQPLDLVKNVPANNDLLENQLDRLALQVQELDSRMQQCFKYPNYEGNDGQPNVVDSTLRLNTLLGFGDDGYLYHFSIDPLLLTLTPPSTINTADIADGAVTAVKMASTLDLSAKTITLPALSVTAGQLAATLDLSSKTLTFANALLSGKHLAASSVVSDHTLGWLAFNKIKVGSGYASFTLSGAGSTAANTTYVHTSTVNSRPKYVASNGYYIEWTGAVWKIYTNASSPLYSSKSGHAWTTADQVGSQWEVGGSDSGINPAPSTTLYGNEVDVTGIVSATSYRGDISQCTGGQVPIPVVKLQENRDPTALGQQCFIGQDNRVYVAGNNAGNTLSPAAAANVKSLIRPPFADGVIAVSGVTADLNGGTDTVVSVAHIQRITLALTAAGFVYAMGYNASGELGQGNTTSSPYFRAIYFNDGGVNKPISKVFCFDSQSTGAYGRCFAIDTSGGVWGWGYNLNGSLGVGDATPKLVPTKVAVLTGKTVTNIVAAGFDTWFLCSDGSVYGAGYNVTGALGVGDYLQKNTATIQPGGLVVTKIAASGRWDGATNAVNFALLTSAGVVWTSGYGNYGGIGDTFTTTRNSLTDISAQIGTATNIFPLGNSYGGFLAVRNDNTIQVWGYNAGTGALGTGAVVNVATPTNPTTLSTAIASTTILDVISVCTPTSNVTDVVLVLLANGQVWGCGDNSAYQLVDGTTVDTTTFKRLGVSAGVTAIRSTGSNSWTYLDSVGKLWAVGGNAEYQAGQGHTDAYGSPVQVKL